MSSYLARIERALKCKCSVNSRTVHGDIAPSDCYCLLAVAVLSHVAVHLRPFGGKKDLGFNCVHPVHSRMCVSSVGEFEAGGFGIVVDGICLFKDTKALGG